MEEQKSDASIKFEDEEIKSENEDNLEEDEYDEEDDDEEYLDEIDFDEDVCLFFSKFIIFIKNKKNEIKAVLNYLLSPLMKEDEYQCFNNAIHHLKNNHDKFFSIYSILSQDHKIFLNDILLCQKIEIENTENKVYRKIVRVKNKKK